MSKTGSRMTNSAANRIKGWNAPNRLPRFAFLLALFGMMAVSFPRTLCAQVSVTFAGAQTALPFTGLTDPVGVAVDRAGDVFVVDTENNRVVELPAGGGAQTTVGTGLALPEGVAVDATGDLFIADTDNNRVVEVPVGGGAQITVPATGLKTPEGVAIDAAGDVFISDTGNNRVV